MIDEHRTWWRLDGWYCGAKSGESFLLRGIVYTGSLAKGFRKNKTENVPSGFAEAVCGLGYYFSCERLLRKSENSQSFICQKINKRWSWCEKQPGFFLVKEDRWVENSWGKELDGNLFWILRGKNGFFWAVLAQFLGWHHLQKPGLRIVQVESTYTRGNCLVIRIIESIHAKILQIAIISSCQTESPLKKQRIARPCFNFRRDEYLYSIRAPGYYIIFL